MKCEKCSKDIFPAYAVIMDVSLSSRQYLSGNPGTSRRSSVTLCPQCATTITSNLESLTDAPTAENLNINQLYDIDSIFPATPTQFVLQDLDDDALPEVIVQMDMNGIENFGSLILHYEDGQVVGYCLWRRAFGDLKTDNTFYTSSGAFDHGYSRIDFSAFDNTADAPSNTIIHPVCYCSSSAGYDENGELIEKYYNDGVEITAEEFEREQERQFAKENVQWMEFTSDNVTSSITQFQNSSNG